MTELELKVLRLEMKTDIQNAVLRLLVPLLFHGQPGPLETWKAQVRAWGSQKTFPNSDPAMSDLMAFELQEIVEKFLRGIE